MVESINVPYKFAPRSYQQSFFDYMYAREPGEKRAVLVWHRRAGKDKCAWNWLILYALMNQGGYYYLFPTYAQGKKVIWDQIDKNGMRFIDHVPKVYVESINKSELKIVFKNGSYIQIVGTDKYDSIRGTNPQGLVFSEYADQDPGAWEAIRPIVDANHGPVVFVFTPRGDNHAKTIYDTALANKNWFVSKLTIEDTGVISPEELAKIRAEDMSEDMIQQEWYVSFTLGIQGSYYAKYVDQAKEAGRIGNVAHDPSQAVYTAWDRGFASAAIIFFQVCGQEIHIIDYYESHDKGLTEHIRMIKSKPYTYEKHFVPHDMDTHEYALSMSAREVASSLGVTFTVLPRENKITEEVSIEALRSLFPRIWIDETNCKQLIKALENYRRKWNEQKKKYDDSPYHDWASHGADAGRYMAQGIKQFISVQQGPNDIQADIWWKKHNPRFQ